MAYNGSLVDTLAAYPYLGLSLFMALLAIIAIVTAKRNAKLLLFSGLLCIPYGLFSFEYIPLYWNPNLIGFFIASPEDLIFSFGGGVLATRMLLSFQDGVYTVSSQPRQIWRRYLLYSAIGIGIGYGVRFGFPATPVMVSTMYGVGLCGLILAMKRRRFLAGALCGGVAFCLVYALLIRLSFLVWPHFRNAWVNVKFHSEWFQGVPLYELYWALGFGIVWPLMAIHCLLDEEAAKHIRLTLLSFLQRMFTFSSRTDRRN
jgi:hypothetical protein